MINHYQYDTGMANRTIAERIEILETRRDKLEAALDAAATGTASVSLDGMSVSYSNPMQVERELARVNRSLQRLYRGGRGFVIDMSHTGASDVSKVINTTYTQVSA